MHTALWQLSCIFCLSSNCHAEYSCEFAFFWVSSLLGWTSRLFIVFMYVLDLFRMISKRLYLPWPWHISIIILASLQAAWAKASGRHNGHRTPKIWKYLKKKPTGASQFSATSSPCTPCTDDIYQTCKLHFLQAIGNVETMAGSSCPELWMRILQEKWTSTYQNKISSCTILIVWSTVRFKSCANRIAL